MGWPRVIGVRCSSSVKLILTPIHFTVVTSFLIRHRSMNDMCTIPYVLVSASSTNNLYDYNLDEPKTIAELANSLLPLLSFALFTS